MAYIFIEPDSSISGEIKVPGDKSISHRAVILGSISNGPTEINGLLKGEDNLSTMAAFRSMGVQMDEEAGGALIISGAGLRGLKEPDDVIDAGNSGTTSRLLTGLLAAQDFFTVLTGDGSLRTRPMRRVVDPLRQMGATITGRAGGAYLPLAIAGNQLTGITYNTPVASAQVKSSILLAGLYAGGHTTVIEPGVSRDHTERMLECFGAEITTAGVKTTVTGGVELKGTRVDVPGDISSAAFFMVAAAVTKDSSIIIKDVGINPTRSGIIDIMERMGMDIEIVKTHASPEPTANLYVKSSALKGITISGEELLPAIDEFPVICVAAALAEGTTTITGAAELRVKESDRISVMAEILTRLGVEVEEAPDGLTITGKETLKSAIIDSHGDHRIAMSAAVAALRSEAGIQIDNSECVEVSFPGFFGLLEETRD